MKQDHTDLEIIVPAPRDPKVVETSRQLERLHSIVELEAVRQVHQWLDTKRLCRQACRVIGDSRIGKTVACDTYQHKHAQQSCNGDAPIVPVIY